MLPGIGYHGLPVKTQVENTFELADWNGKDVDRLERTEVGLPRIMLPTRVSSRVWKVLLKRMGDHNIATRQDKFPEQPGVLHHPHGRQHVASGLVAIAARVVTRGPDNKRVHARQCDAMQPRGFQGNLLQGKTNLVVAVHRARRLHDRGRNVVTVLNEMPSQLLLQVRI